MKLKIKNYIRGSLLLFILIHITGCVSPVPFNLAAKNIKPTSSMLDAKLSNIDVKYPVLRRVTIDSDDTSKSDEDDEWGESDIVYLDSSLQMIEPAAGNLIYDTFEVDNTTSSGIGFRVKEIYKEALKERRGLEKNYIYHYPIQSPV